MILAVQLLDTDILIDILRGFQPAVEWFASLEEVPSVPGFVVMELIQDADNKQRVARSMKLISPLAIVWPTSADCERALEDFRAMHLSHGIGLLDALIAGCARGRNATLLTFNVKHYQAIQDLSLDQPYSRDIGRR